MKNLFVFLLITILNVNLFSQNISSNIIKKIDPRLISILNTPPNLLKSASLTLPGSIQIDNDVLRVIVKTNNVSELKAEGFNVNSSFQKFSTIRMNPWNLAKLASINGVEFISAGHVTYPTNDVGGATVGAKLLNSGYINNTQYKGQGVLLCIIDTGIDWKHLDFRDPTDTTKSRIVYIWDQTLTKTGIEKTPQDRDGVNLAGLNYGVEYSQLDIDNELNGSTVGLVREKDINGHGSHVAGIAAGNGATLLDKKYAGIAPEADLLIVKAGNGSFPDNNVIDALTYAGKIAAQLGKPIVVNMSLGSDGGPHDGSTTKEQAVDNFVTSANGRVCVISAGNSGASNIHITGTIPNSSTIEFDINVPSYTPQAGNNNDNFDFDLWFNTNGGVSATVTTPNAIQVSSSTSTNDGDVFIGNAVDGNNNNREVEYYIYDQDATKPPAQGNWKFYVTNTSGSSMIYHGWLNDASMPATLTNGDANYTVGSPGTATDALTVGSFVTRWSWKSINGGSYEYTGTNLSDNISSFSSIGPRRDGVQKPDIAAPGQAIISVKSSDSSPDSTWVIPGGKYLVEQGTSMSSPMTAGCVALLLQQNPDLSYGQVKSYIINNASTDSYTSTVPNYSWGYGKLNIFSSMVSLLNPGGPKNFKIFIYDQWNNVQYGYTNLNPNDKIAVRFTPGFSGTVVGGFIDLYNNNIVGNISFEIWSDNGGLPGSKLGNTVNYDASNINPNTWNFIDLQTANVSVTSGTDYHIIAYFSSGSATGVFLDDGNIDNRSSKYSNSTSLWAAYPYDLRIRPIVAADKSLPVEQNAFVPLKYDLYNNFPNPFNPSTIIKYDLPKSSFVRLKIYDILGREIKTLVNNEQIAGKYEVPFIGTNLASGVYFYRIEAGDFIETKKMVLLK